MKKSLTTLTLCAALLSGCATQSHPTGFYWGNYSRTLYEYQKNPNATTLQAHQHSLQDIIDSAGSGRSKVPPGVYAELGKIYLDQGNKDEAVKWFQQEASAFPESAHLMKTLIEKAG